MRPLPPLCFVTFPWIQCELGVSPISAPVSPTHLPVFTSSTTLIPCSIKASLKNHPLQVRHLSSLLHICSCLQVHLDLVYSDCLWFLPFWLVHLPKTSSEFTTCGSCALLKLKLSLTHTSFRLTVSEFCVDNHSSHWDSVRCVCSEIRRKQKPAGPVCGQMLCCLHLHLIGIIWETMKHIPYALWHYVQHLSSLWLFSTRYPPLQCDESLYWKVVSHPLAIHTVEDRVSSRISLDMANIFIQYSCLHEDYFTCRRKSKYFQVKYKNGPIFWHLASFFTIVRIVWYKWINRKKIITDVYEIRAQGMFCIQAFKRAAMWDNLAFSDSLCVWQVMTVIFKHEFTFISSPTQRNHTHSAAALNKPYVTPSGCMMHSNFNSSLFFIWNKLRTILDWLMAKCPTI